VLLVERQRGGSVTNVELGWLAMYTMSIDKHGGPSVRDATALVG
jgi:hypothetical protein